MSFSSTYPGPRRGRWQQSTRREDLRRRAAQAVAAHAYAQVKVTPPAAQSGASLRRYFRLLGVNLGRRG